MACVGCRPDQMGARPGPISSGLWKKTRELGQLRFPCGKTSQKSLVRPRSPAVLGNEVFLWRAPFLSLPLACPCSIRMEPSAKQLAPAHSDTLCSGHSVLWKLQRSG